MKLICSAADDQQRGIPVIPLDRKIFRVAVAPKDSHRLERALLSGFGRAYSGAQGEEEDKETAARDEPHMIEVTAKQGRDRGYAEKS